jgi:hypothetical protein
LERSQVVAEIKVIEESVVVEWVQQGEGSLAKLCFIRAILEAIIVRRELEDVVLVRSVGVDYLD